MTPVSPPIAEIPPTLGEQAYREIRSRILDCTYAPGDVLSERVLAEHLNLGKAPVRAALVRLAADGLVTIASRQGIVITTPSIEDILELYEMRYELESLVVRSISGRLTNIQKKRLEKNLADLSIVVATKHATESIDLDFEFHRLLCDFHGNRQICRVMENVFFALYREIRRAQVRFPERMIDSLKEHEGVAHAIFQGEPAQAERLMREHLIFGEEVLLSRLGQNRLRSDLRNANPDTTYTPLNQTATPRAQRN